MADETKVETATQDAQTPAATPPPAPSTPAPAGAAAPATTPTPKTYTDDDVKAAVAQTRREAQIAKDREVARLHQQYQQKLQQTVGKTREALAQAGVRDTAAVEKDMIDGMELEEYRAWKQQSAASQATFEYGTGIIQDIAARFEVEIDPNDPALWVPSNSWQEFTDRVRKAATEKAKAAREAEKAKEDAARTKATDARVASGSLDTLDVTPAGATAGASEFDNYSPKDAGKLWDTANRRARQGRSPQR